MSDTVSDTVHQRLDTAAIRSGILNPATLGLDSPFGHVRRP
jgi:hypothetical protein